MDQFIGRTIRGKAGTGVDGVEVLIESIMSNEIKGTVTVANSAATIYVDLVVSWMIPNTPELRVAFESDFLDVWGLA